MKRPFVHRDRALPAHNIIDAIKILLVPNTYSKCSQFTLLQSTYHSQDSVSCQRAFSGPSLLTVIRARGGRGRSMSSGCRYRFRELVPRQFFSSQIRCTRSLFVKHAPGGALLPSSVAIASLLNENWAMVWHYHPFSRSRA